MKLNMRLIQSNLARWRREDAKRKEQRHARRNRNEAEQNQPASLQLKEKALRDSHHA